MTFFEKYSQAKTWQERVLVMEIFHLTMSSHHKNWTITKTANEFSVSIGLVSENLKLANYVHSHPELMKVPLRQDALRKIR